MQAFDAGRDGNVPFLVTEFVPGSDLRKYVRQYGPLTMRAAATIITQAARGLGHAHEQGLIHRDMKPGDLLVTPKGKTKVSDLGLAGWLNDTDINPRRAKSWARPIIFRQQILTPHKVTASSDIYFARLYTLLRGNGKSYHCPAAQAAIRRRSVKDQPLHPRRLNPDLTDKFIDVIAAMIDKDLQMRTPSAADVIRLL